jgi:hypothetical protein
MEHAAELDAAMNYSRDYDYDYFGFKTLERSYLLRANGRIVERPQHMLMRVSVGIHKSDVARAIETYNLLSQRCVVPIRAGSSARAQRARIARKTPFPRLHTHALTHTSTPAHHAPTHPSMQLLHARVSDAVQRRHAQAAAEQLLSDLHEGG